MSDQREHLCTECPFPPGCPDPGRTPKCSDCIPVEDRWTDSPD